MPKATYRFQSAQRDNTQPLTEFLDICFGILAQMANIEF